MATNEERREVALNLREKYRERNRSDVFVPQDVGLQARIYLEDLVSCVPDGESLFTVLADLIEPEPERTCHPFVSPDGAGWYAIGCSNCGNGFAENNPDKAYLLRISKRSDIMPRYCPNCGAKVIDDAEDN